MLKLKVFEGQEGQTMLVEHKAKLHIVVFHANMKKLKCKEHNLLNDFLIPKHIIVCVSS